MKIAFIVTAHWSDELRPNGQDLLLRYLSSIYENCNFNFHIFIVDNQSQWPLSIPDDDNCTYIRIDNQYEKGITGAWNLGLFKAYSENFDILINCNDDLYFDDTINNFIETIIQFDDSENVVFCPLADNILPTYPMQMPNNPRTGLQVLDCTMDQNAPNGFLFGITKEHYSKYTFQSDEYFNVNNINNGGDGKWGGQEGQFIENRLKGSYGIVVNECLVFHTKIRGWKVPRNIDKENKLSM